MISFPDVVAFLVAVFGMLAIWVLFTTLPVMLLWNWLVPVLFGLPDVTFFQALGLNFLFGLLFRTTVRTKDS